MTESTSTPSVATAEPEQFAVIITLPTWGAPEGIDQVRRVGPYLHKHRATNAASSFAMMLHSSAPDGTTIEVGPYDVTVPHLDPYPPANAYELANAICDEPDGPGGGWGFPDLYARLSASIGHDRARKVWGSACTYLDDMAEAEAAERAAAAKFEAKLAPLRARVAGAAARRPSAWYTAPIRDAAVWLLYDMLAAAEPRGATLDNFDSVLVDLPSACVDVTMMRYAQGFGPDEHLDQTRADAILATLTLALGERGVLAERRGFGVAILDERCRRRLTDPLAVTLHTEPRWSLVYACGGTSPSATIYAPFDETGALAIADMIAELVDGKRPNPLDR